jgi:hypothetical protein
VLLAGAKVTTAPLRYLMLSERAVMPGVAAVNVTPSVLKAWTGAIVAGAK